MRTVTGVALIAGRPLDFLTLPIDDMQLMMADKASRRKE
jgi:hypothetical protein